MILMWRMWSSLTTSERLLTAFPCIFRRKPPQPSYSSGGGKTTLCHLIARFWDVDKGCVSLGGVDVKEYSMDSLMRNFSFVFQSVYLFQDTIANNIRFGQPDAPMEKVIEAAKKPAVTISSWHYPMGMKLLSVRAAQIFPAVKNSAFPLPEPL